MTTYLIGYDLHPTEDETYDELFEAIRKFSPRWHHLDSTWIVVADKTAVEVRDALTPHIYKDDQLLVVKSGRKAAWFGFNDEGGKWLKDHL